MLTAVQVKSEIIIIMYILRKARMPGEIGVEGKLLLTGELYNRLNFLSF